MASSSLEHPPGQAAELARRLVDLSRAIQCACRAGDFDQLPDYLDERQRLVDRLDAQTIRHDVAAVRLALESVAGFDRSVQQLLAVEVEHVQYELSQLPVWRRTLSSYGLGKVASRQWLDEAG